MKLFPFILDGIQHILDCFFFFGFCERFNKTRCAGIVTFCARSTAQLNAALSRQLHWTVYCLVVIVYASVKDETSNAKVVMIESVANVNSLALTRNKAHIFSRFMISMTKKSLSIVEV